MMNRGKITVILLGILITVLFINVFCKKNPLSNNEIVKDKQMIKAEMIELFNNNYTYFTEIAEYAAKTEGSFNAKNNGKRVIIKNLRVNNTNIIEDKEVLEAAEIIINNAYIVEIGEDKSATWFFTKEISGVEYGLFCKKNKEDSFDFLEEVEGIKENWYYYSTIIENE